MTRGRRRLLVLAAIVLAAVSGAALLVLPSSVPAGVAVMKVTAPDPGDRPLAVRLWMPEGDSEGLPLVVISHGTGGDALSHQDTAIALARAGYVVAAVTHTGDNARDSSYVAKGLHLVGRPRHVSRVIDYLLTRWPQRNRIDPSRIGLFGFSAGGFTALVVAGGEPDMSRGPERCRRRPTAWDCRYLKEHGLDLARLGDGGPAIRWHHDSRVRALVVAAPAIGYSFVPDRLAAVRLPLQLWEARHDAIVGDSPALVAGALRRTFDRHIVDGAGHFSFLAPCGWRMRAIIALLSMRGIPDICADASGFDRAAFHRKFNREVIAFFGRSLARAD